MKHAIERSWWWVVAWVLLGLGWPSGRRLFAQRTTEKPRDGGGVVVDLSHDIHEVPTLETSWDATSIADPAHIADQGGVIKDFVSPAHGGPSPFSGPVRDAGTIVVELEGSSELELSLGCHAPGRSAHGEQAREELLPPEARGR